MELNDEQLRLLGEIVARGAFVEGLAATCIDYLVLGRQLVEGEDGEMYHVGLSELTDGQQAHWLLDRVDRLADRAGDLEPDIRAWVRQARTALEERNSLVHSMWFAPHMGGTIGLRARSRGPVVRIAGTEEFRAARDSVAEAQREGRRLTGLLGGLER